VLAARSALPYIVAEGQAMGCIAQLYYNYPELPAQRPAEILGTPCMRSYLYHYNNLYYDPSVGIGCEQRQPIAVPCIAEHA